MDKKQKYFFKKCVSFSELGLAGGDKVSTIQVLRTGSWNHPVYGEFSINTIDLEQFVQNFKNNIRWTKLCVDVNHDPEHRAVGWYTDLYRDGEALFAVIEWNDEGVALITSKQYRYFSPELYFSYKDDETGVTTPNVLVGGGITNRPFFKGMQALQMSEPENAIAGETRKTFYFFNHSDSMKKSFSQIVAAFKDVAKIGAAELDEARLAFSELSKDEQAAAFSDMGAIERKFSAEDDGAGEGDGGGEGGDDAAKAAEAAAAAAALKASEDAAAQAAADAAAAAAAAGGDGAGEGKALEASEIEKTVAAKLFAETGMTLEEIKAQQKAFSEIQLKQYKSDLEKQVDGFVFSEANKSGTLLWKSKGLVVEFAAKLPQNLVKEFFEIVKGKNFAGAAVEFGENGKSGDAQAFSVPDTTPDNVDRESFVLATIASQFSEVKKMSLTDATIEAHKYIRANNIK